MSVFETGDDLADAHCLDWESSWLDGAAWIASADHMGRQIPDHYSSRAHNTQFPYRYAGANEYVGGKPCVASDGYGSTHQWHGPAIEIMRAGTEMAVLTDIRTVFERDRGQIIESDVTTNHRARLQN